MASPPKKKLAREPGISHRYDPKFSSILDVNSLTDCLLRLPIKSLLRFRCVSSGWRELISSPRFQRLHFHFSCRRNNGEPECLLIARSHDNGADKNDDAIFKSVEISVLINDMNCVASPGAGAGCGLDTKFNIAGCYNGIFCICTENHTYLWNPAIRKQKELPSSAVHDPDAIYGFGYDDVVQDYKVLKVSYSVKDRPSYPNVEIYSLNTNTWKSIKNWPCNALVDNCEFVNGAFHILTKDQIVSLNVATEEYVILPKPKFEETDDYWLANLRGCLSMICKYDTWADVWLMEQYGDGNSWSLSISIGGIERYKHNVFNPRYVSPSGMVLIQLESARRLYNSNSGTFDSEDIPLCYGFKALPYTSSLFCPKSENEGQIEVT